MLRKWKELGVDDAEQLRRLLIRRSLRPAITVGFQAALDGLVRRRAEPLAALQSKAWTQQLRACRAGRVGLVLLLKPG